MAVRVGEGEGDRAVGIECVLDFALTTVDVVGQTVTVWLDGDEADNASTAERRQRFTHPLGPRLRGHLSLAFDHFAVEAAIEVRVGGRRVVVVVALGVAMAI